MVTEKIKLDDALDKACICKYIHELVSGKMTQLQVLESVSSTNDEVMSSLQQGLEGYIGCVTNEQTEGRGRNGKAWESPANSNIYMSIGCHLDASQLNGLAALSLACGVAVARLLYATGVKVNLKWPNDVLFNEKKLAGLLVETRISPSKVYVVVGLGLNIDICLSQHQKELISHG